MCAMGTFWRCRKIFVPQYELTFEQRWIRHKVIPSTCPKKAQDKKRIKYANELRIYRVHFDTVLRASGSLGLTDSGYKTSYTLDVHYHARLNDRDGDLAGYWPMYWGMYLVHFDTFLRAPHTPAGNS
jgi:hypothetical protein